MEEQRKRLETASKELENAKKAVRESKRVTKAPGYGKWTRVPGSEDRAVAGYNMSYHVPDHPEWGQVKVYRFNGWPLQRVAARASVTYANTIFEWNGAGAVNKANEFLANLFGII
jgi:hypothetical protein